MSCFLHDQNVDLFRYAFPEYSVLTKFAQHCQCLPSEWQNASRWLHDQQEQPYIQLEQPYLQPLYCLKAN